MEEEKYALVLGDIVYVFDDREERTRVINTLMNSETFKFDYTKKHATDSINTDFSVYTIPGKNEAKNAEIK